MSRSENLSNAILNTPEVSVSLPVKRHHAGDKFAVVLTSFAKIQNHGIGSIGIFSDSYQGAGIPSFCPPCSFSFAAEQSAKAMDTRLLTAAPVGLEFSAK